jgi:Immunity protein 35
MCALGPLCEAERVISYDEARLTAQRHLDRSPVAMVITGHEEFDEGWVFFYDSVRHQETGGLLDALAGNGAILIDRETGQIHGTGTAKPVEEYIEQYRESKRRARQGWPQGLDDRFAALLALVRDGLGLRDARRLDLLISCQYAPRQHVTVLEELVELERRGLVRRRPASAGGTGYRWQITDLGHGSVP